MTQPRFSTDPAPHSSTAPAGLVDPSAANHDQEWLRTVTSIGVVTLLVQCKTMEQAALAECLGEELEAAGFGVLDSTEWQKHRHFFYVGEEHVPAAVNLFKAGLEKRGLLSHALIAQYDPDSKRWRTFHAGDQLT